jgi:hypothetical protein
LQTSWYANPVVWSFGLTAAAFAAFALLLSLRWRGELRSALLLAAVILSALWATSAAAFAYGGAWQMWRTGLAFDALRLLAFLAFLLALLRGPALATKPGAGRSLHVVVAFLGVASLLLGFPPPDIPEPGGRSYVVAFGLMLTFAIIGLAASEQLFRRTPDALRWNVWPLCLGLGGLFAFDLVLFTDALLFRVLDGDLWVARGLVQALCLPLLGLAAARNREWTFDVALSRDVVLGSSALIGASLYLLAVAALGYHVRMFGGQWGTTIATVLIAAAILVIGAVAASKSLRARLRVIVAKNLLARRYDYREEWLKFTRLIAHRDQGSSLQVRGVLALGELVETASGALWLRRDGTYQQVERVAQPLVAEREAEDSDLIGFLRETGWVIEVGEARRDPARYRGLRLPQWLMASPNAWLVVPLLAADDLVGFVVLGRPRIQLTLDWEILDLLKIAGRQTAGYLAQAQATEALLEARKFESFNRMSAFVVHDLKNLVAQLQLMLRNAERHESNPEFRRDMLATVGNVVARMNSLLLQLRSGEQPVDRPHVVDVGGVLSRVESVRATGRVGLVVEVDGRLEIVGHADRLERVIGHLVQNAFESIEAAGIAVPRVRVRALRSADRVLIEVSDNGAGMTPDFIRDRLFKPFSSTKQTGMGIGTFESRQYLQSIGGQIEVESEPQIGTTFRLTLRAADAASIAREAAA